MWACSTEQESVSTLFLVLVLAIYVVVVSYLVNRVTSLAAADSKALPENQHPDGGRPKCVPDHVLDDTKELTAPTTSERLEVMMAVKRRRMSASKPLESSKWTESMSPLVFSEIWSNFLDWSAPSDRRGTIVKDTPRCRIT